MTPRSIRSWLRPWSVTLIVSIVYLGVILAAHGGDPHAKGRRPKREAPKGARLACGAPLLTSGRARAVVWTARDARALLGRGQHGRAKPPPGG